MLMKLFTIRKLFILFLELMGRRMIQLRRQSSLDFAFIFHTTKNLGKHLITELCGLEETYRGFQPNLLFRGGPNGTGLCLTEF